MPKQAHGPRKFHRWMLVLAGAALACGCEPFQSLPLSGGAGKELTPEALAEIRTQAGEIRHPILRPVRIDLRDGLSPDEAGVLAVLANPSLRAVRDARQLADAQLLQAGLLPNPRLSAGYGVPLGNDKENVNPYAFGLDWDVSSVIARSAKIDAARGQRASVDLDIAWQEWQVAQAAKTAVSRVAALEKQTALARKTAEVLDDQRDAIAKAVARGAATAQQQAAVNAANRHARQQLLDTEKQLAARRLELNRLLGLHPGAALRIAESPGLPVRFDSPSPNSLCNGIERRRPDLLALRRGYDSQQAAVRAAILGQFPKVGIGVSRDRDTDKVNTVGFQVGVDLPIFDRNQSRIAAERATRQKLHDEYADRVFQARSDVAMLVSGIRFLNRQIAEVRAANADFQNLADTYQRAMNDGRADAVTAMDARARLDENRQKEIALRGQLAEAVCALELATGLYHIK